MTGRRKMVGGDPLQSPFQEEGALSVNENSVVQADCVSLLGDLERSAWWGWAVEEMLTAQLLP